MARIKVRYPSPPGLSLITSLHRLLVSLLCLVGLSVSASLALAQLHESELNKSVVSINVHGADSVEEHRSGYVIQSENNLGIIISDYIDLQPSETVTVVDPDSGAELVAQVLRNDAEMKYALLKVVGLGAPPLVFSQTTPKAGDFVWSVVKSEDGAIEFSRGILRSRYKSSGPTVEMFNHTAVLEANGGGSLLLNECGQIIGLNQPGSSGGVTGRALSLLSLYRVFESVKVSIRFARAVCLSEIAQAQKKAEYATIEAGKAKEEAARAQALVASLHARLEASSERNQSLLLETQRAQQKAESALEAVKLAEKNVEKNRIDLEKKTAMLKAEAEAMRETYDQERAASDAKFEQTIRAQQDTAETREYLLMGLLALTLLVGLMIAFLFRKPPLPEGSDQLPAQPPELPDLPIGSETTHLDELVLDGRDEDGIRYLLRISGDKISEVDGIVIGRNPKDSPYIINHADVSRKHARMKVMKNRVFIEDLGSTNGTSVNGQSIEDKGPVSVDSGDQIIIGSVVMNLRVLSA